MMKTIPLVKSKLMIPVIPDKALYSQRIKNLNIQAYKAAIITAPSGFGKTTAVILSLRDNNEQICWYRMEKDDAFLPLFYAHLTYALFPDIDRASLDCVRSLTSLNDFTEEYLLQNALVCQDAWIHYSKKDNPIYLIFDDFHNVLENPIIGESVRYFITNMPETVHIIVMSRAETGILSGRLSYDINCKAISEKDLRFTDKETKELLTEKYRLFLTPVQINNIMACSEGWIAAITIICHMSDFSVFYNKPPTGAINVDNPELFKLFFSEFLNGIGDKMLTDLTKMSLLYDFSCDDLRAIFNITNAEEIVGWLEKSNIYIQKFMSSPVKYRFHSLFRIELEASLHERLSDDKIKSLYLKAADYYKNCGDLHLAIHFYIAADNLEEAVRVASDEGVHIINMSNPEKLIPIIMEFPDYCIQSNPYLLLYKGISIMNIQSKDSFQSFLNSLLLFREKKDIKLMMDAFGMTIPMSFVKNNYTYIKSAVNLIPKLRVLLTNKNGRKKLLLSAFMGAVLADKLTLANILCKLLKSAQDLGCVWEYCFYIVKGVVLYRRGLFAEALINNQKILCHETALSSDQWRAVGLSCCHNAPWLMGDIEESQKYLDEFALIAEKYDSNFARGYALRLSAYLKHQSLDFSEVIRLMEESAGAFLKDGNPTMACVINTTKYLWEAEINGLTRACAQKAAKELKKLQSLESGQGFLELCQTITGALFKECGKYTEAEKLLKKSLYISKRKKATQSMCGSIIHLCDLYYRTGNKEKEYHMLKTFGKLITEHGYEYFREMNYSTLVRVCARCVEKGIAKDKVRKIISRYFSYESLPYFTDNPSVIANEPMKFICSFAPLRQGPKTLRVEFFGGFKIISSAATIDETQWKTRKTGGILKYILANYPAPVSRDTLAALFWPDSDAKAAYTSLRAALYELRKTLARNNMAFEGENALLCESKKGIMVHEGSVIKTDVKELTDACKELKAKSLTKERHKELLITIIQLYKGDFLPADSYDEWVTIEQERYRAMFINASHALVSVYLRDNERENAQDLLLKLMTIDPLDELACGLLLFLYRSGNKLSLAASLEKRFSKMFESEMGLKPDFNAYKQHFNLGQSASINTGG